MFLALVATFILSFLTHPTHAATDPGTYRFVHVGGNYIALTFDDGPGAYTNRLLDILNRQEVKATFFVVGNMAQQRPDVVRRMVAEGHEVGNHSWNHIIFTALGREDTKNVLPPRVDQELLETHNLIMQLSGNKFPLVMRPPGGAMWSRQRRLAEQRFGYKIVEWSLACGDTAYPRPSSDQIRETIVNRTRVGSIILAHDIHKVTVDAMEATITELKARGFQFVTVSELLAMGNQETPGPSIAPPPPPPPTSSAPPPSPPHITYYTVKRGDTLEKICGRLGCEIKAVCSANEIADPNKIYVGQKLQIPR